MVDALLSDVRVLEVTSGIAGACAARFLADWGADVIKVEPPTGDPARRLGPFPSDEPHQERSAWFLYLNTNKRGITLNVETGTGRHLLQKLLAQCDVLMEDLSTEEAHAMGLDPDSLLSAFPNLVVVSVTPFGRSGPYTNYKASDIVLQAMGGFMHCNGRPDLPPISAPWEQAAQFGGKAAAVAAMLALTHHRATGEGQHVDVSLWECLACESPMQGASKAEAVDIIAGSWTVSSRSARTAGLP